MAFRDDLAAAQRRAEAAEAEVAELRAKLAAERNDRTVDRTELAGDRVAAVA